MGQKPFIVWIDDVNHVKHYRSLLDLQSDPAASRLSLNWDEGWGVALING
jgi:hypothetical protein